MLGDLSMNTEQPSNDGLKGGLLLVVLGVLSIGVGVVTAQWLLSAWQ
jgi:hypothetical protein